MMKRVIAVALGLLMLLAVMPLAFAETDAIKVRDYYYSSHDFYAVQDFLEQTDEDGVTNGEKINPDYDPWDPDTWYSEYYDEDTETWYVDAGFTFWTVAGNLLYLDWASFNVHRLVGHLDLSDCIYIEYLSCAGNYLYSVDVHGCSSLVHLLCYGNYISSVNFSSCDNIEYVDLAFNCISGEFHVRNFPALVQFDVSENALDELNIEGNQALRYLYCNDNILDTLNITNCPGIIELDAGWNELTSVNVSGMPSLEWLSLNDNELTDLNVTSCPGLYHLTFSRNYISSINLTKCTELGSLGARGNPLTTLDLSKCTNIPHNKIKAEGDGTIGYVYYITVDDDDNSYIADYAEAYPNAGSVLDGWYGKDGAKLSTDEFFDLVNVTEKELTARFAVGDFLMGDADRNGTVDTTDALLVLRCALSISGSVSELMVNCDMDGNGTIDTTDALYVLRLALHIG